MEGTRRQRANCKWFAKRAAGVYWSSVRCAGNYFGVAARRLGMLALSVALVCPAVGAEAKLKVLTTFLPGYSLARQVAGENATVENLLPGNVSLHDYQLSPGDIRKIAAADVVVFE